MEYAMMALVGLLVAAVAWIVYDARARRRAAREEAHEHARDQELVRATADMMAEAIALRVGKALGAIEGHEARLADQVRGEAASARVRARVREKELEQVTAPLQALSTLAVNQREAATRSTELLGALQSLVGRLGLGANAAQLSPALPAAAPAADDDERQTHEVLIPAAADVETCEENERTCVVHAPPGFIQSPKLLRAPRPASPPAPANDDGGGAA